MQKMRGGNARGAVTAKHKFPFQTGPNVVYYAPFVQAVLRVRRIRGKSLVQGVTQ